MKRLLKPLLFSLATGLFLLGSTLCAQAQATVRASFDDSGTITLPDSPAPANMYELDISQLNFADVNEAVKFFSSFNTENAYIRPVVSHGIAVLYLRSDSDQTVEGWNTYLTKHPLAIADGKAKLTQPETINPKN